MIRNAFLYLSVNSTQKFCNLCGKLSSWIITPKQLLSFLFVSQLKAQFFWLWTQPQANFSNLCTQEQLPLEPSEMFIPPQTRLNLDQAPYNRETLGYGRIQTKTAEFKGPKLGPEKCFCHWPTTAAQLAVSFCCPVSVIDGWWWTSEEILTLRVCTRTPRSHKCTRQPLDASQHVCEQMNVWARCVPLEAGCRFHILLCL